LHHMLYVFPTRRSSDLSLCGQLLSVLGIQVPLKRLHGFRAERAVDQPLGSVQMPLSGKELLQGLDGCRAGVAVDAVLALWVVAQDRTSTRLKSSHVKIS